MIPILVEAIKEQQNKIDFLQNMVFEKTNDIIFLMEQYNTCCQNNPYYSTPKNSDEENNYKQEFKKEKAELYQNTPNPFSSNTEISCYLPENPKQASIHIYNLQGIELKSYSLTQTGLNTVIVNGSELSAGMYLYTLIVDNNIIDTKRMILTK